MTFDLKTIEALAPDQSSLSAASKLTKRSNWVKLEQKDDLLWGECQGSGANPYRVCIDASDQGYKCTCPSRKFPCKHSLALMWIEATAPTQFTPSSDIPEWVNDWLGRRRKTGGALAANAGPAKSIDEVQVEVEAKPEDPAAVAKREAAQKKRQEDTKSAISGGLDELDQWISDQLRLGLSAFGDAASERCRRIAARLVDSKAAGLASRLDEFPAVLIGLRTEERPEAAMREFGKLVLLMQAWRQNPDDPELKRLIGATETRDQVIASSDAPRINGEWEVLGEKIETRRDGLVSHATWLLQVDAPQPRFAILQDFYPASAGRRSHAFSAGERFEAELAFYPARAPLRALVVSRGQAKPSGGWTLAPAETADPLSSHVILQDLAPWSAQTPLILGPGALAKDDRGQIWWKAKQGSDGVGLPVQGEIPEPALGMELSATAGLWNGAQLELLAAHSNHGRLDF